MSIEERTLGRIKELKLHMPSQYAEAAMTVNLNNIRNLRLRFVINTYRVNVYLLHTLRGKYVFN